jgi:predicted nucleic acid-binding protein
VTVVVDTSILVDHLRGDQRARDLLRGAVRSRERLTASAMTRVEVLAGIRPGEETDTRRLLALLEWIPVDDAMAESAGELARNYLQSHPGVDPVDYVIAATVERVAAELWTRNVKHFPMFPGLRDPYEGPQLP